MPTAKIRVLAVMFVCLAVEALVFLRLIGGDDVIVRWEEKRITG